MYQLFCLREAIRTGSNLCYCGECKWCGMGDVVHSAGRVLYMDREWSDFLCFYLIRYNYAVKNTGVGIYLRVIYWMLCDVCSRRRWETGNTNSPFGNTSGMDDGSDRRMDVSKSQMIKIRIYKERVAYPRRGSGSLFFYGL